MKNLATISFVLLATIAHSQRYKDIFPKIADADQQTQFELLSDFVETHMDHPNANFRLALIYTERYKKINLLKDNDLAVALAREAEKRLIKASVLVDSREIRKNGLYYIGLLDSTSTVYPTPEDVLSRIEDEQYRVTEFLERGKPIFNDFTRSVEMYDSAVKRYFTISDQHSSLKELYLMMDDSLKYEMGRLKQNYDSCIFYMNRYLKQTANYRINTVKQSILIQPITIFRKDGLVAKVDFLQPEVKLWNYGAWVDSVESNVRRVVEPLRYRLEANELELDQALREFEKSSDRSSFQVVSPEKELMFDLMQMDYRNALTPLLYYQSFKQELLKEKMRDIYFDTAGISIERKLNFYNQMVHLCSQADSTLNEAYIRFDIHHLERHKAFVKEFFLGPEGFKEYIIAELSLVRSWADQYINQLEAGTNQSLLSKGKKLAITYNKMRISLTPDSVYSKDGLKTSLVLTSADGSIYVAGQMKPRRKTGRDGIFVARISAQGRILWFRSSISSNSGIKLPDEPDINGGSLTPKGLALVVHSRLADEQDSLIFSFFRERNGEVVTTKLLDAHSLLRDIIYDETTNTFTLAFLGDKEKLKFDRYRNLFILNLDEFGNPQWNYTFNVKGELLKILRVKDGYLALGNEIPYIRPTERKQLEVNRNNAYVLKLNDRGVFQHLLMLRSPKSYMVDRVNKINDSGIFLSGPNKVRMLINSDLGIVYNSLSNRID